MTDSLVPSVLEQKVTATEAHHAWRYLLRRHGTVTALRIGRGFLDSWPGCPHGGELGDVQQKVVPGSVSAGPEALPW
ncbi:hypothetical protein GCM10009663_71910 [Kitasatospora arboriphila]|uniref:Uncharacterized protein n=1 Tax=Kitasatospora arboriphila TaxID=258052 RepID=A0ABN1U5J3_9ACTN